MAPCFREPLIESVMPDLYFVVRLQIFGDVDHIDDFRFFICSYRRLKETIKKAFEFCEKCFGKLELVSCYDDLDHVKDYIYRNDDIKIRILCICVNPSRVLL